MNDKYVTPDTFQVPVRFAHGANGDCFRGRMIDPETKRVVIACDACGQPHWHAPRADGAVPVPGLCDECAGRCHSCGRPTKWTADNQDPDDEFGRPMCGPCWGVGSTAADDALDELRDVAHNLLEANGVRCLSGMDPNALADFLCDRLREACDKRRMGEAAIAVEFSAAVNEWPAYMPELEGACVSIATRKGITR